MNVIMIGAHPDDCEVRCGGTAARLAQAGHRVKFVSMTDGSAGHQAEYGARIAARRREESAEAARRLGIAAYDVLPHPDGSLQPTPEARADVIRLIRGWKTDVAITHRPNDYHPDHRYTSVLVQDSAYLVMVPGVCPDTEPLRRNPVYLYMEDGFRRPYPFQADVVVDIEAVWQRKVDAVDAHASQFYEWLPWVDEKWGAAPAEPRERREWLDGKLRAWAFRKDGGAVAEAFELCEYGRRPAAEELAAMFPG